MGFLNKIKDILFEDVEEEEVKKEKVVKEDTPEVRKPIAEKIEPQKREETFKEVAPKVQPNNFMERKTPVEDNIENLNERDLFKSENTFPFPDFDEEEFSQSLNRTQKPKPTTNVLEYEKKKKVEKKYDLGRFERIEKTEYVEKKKFKPSPIISPVYGILNEDYKIEDIKDKTDYNNNNPVDFDSVRKKAFGNIEKLDDQLEDTPKETYYEETVTVKLKEPEKEKIEKVRKIDELLEDTADMAIEETQEEPKTVYEQIDDELDEIMPEPKEEVIHEKTEEEKIEDSDTLENDLFDLIDSMYDNREDGEL